METTVHDRPSRFRTTKNQHISDLKHERLIEQRVDQRDTFLSAVERGDVNWFTDRARAFLQWERLARYLPPWPDPHRPTPAVDRVVGLVLHCVILSAVVLGAALVRGARSLAKFVCYVTLHWYIYRGDILPICEGTPGPITLARIENATLMESHGFRVILISSRPHSPTTTASEPEDPSHCLSLSRHSSSEVNLPPLAFDLEATESCDVIDQLELPGLADLISQSHQLGLGLEDLHRPAEVSPPAHRLGSRTNLPRMEVTSSKTHQLCLTRSDLKKYDNLLKHLSNGNLQRPESKARGQQDMIDQFDLSYDDSVHSLAAMSMGSRDHDVIGPMGSCHSAAKDNLAELSTRPCRTDVIDLVSSCHGLAEMTKSSNHSIGKFGSFHSKASHSLADLSSLTDAQID